MYICCISFSVENQLNFTIKRLNVIEDDLEHIEETLKGIDKQLADLGEIKR